MPTRDPGSPPSAARPAPRLNPLPPTGAIDQLSPQQLTDLRRLFESLDLLDYFQVLVLPITATAGEIKAAFYRESRIYHPDRVFHLPECEQKSFIGGIYKRMTEAYAVLRDPQKRAKYLADIGGPERTRRLRYTEASESEQKAEAKKAVEEEVGTNPKARQLYKQAMRDLESGNWSAAERNLKTAITFEPSNARYKEKLAEVGAKIDAERKARNDTFKIK